MVLNKTLAVSRYYLRWKKCQTCSMCSIQRSHNGKLEDFFFSSTWTAGWSKTVHYFRRPRCVSDLFESVRKEMLSKSKHFFAVVPHWCSPTHVSSGLQFTTFRVQLSATMLNIKRGLECNIFRFRSNKNFFSKKKETPQ